MGDKFIVGKVYTSTCWFTGGITYMKCVSRTEHTVTFSEVNKEIDGIHNTGLQIYNISLDDGKEFVVLYRYRDHENRMYAA